MAVLPETLFGRDARESADIVRRATGIERLEEVRARVADVRRDPYGKLILTLDSGQVWSQLDSPGLNLRPGEEVHIRRAALGSFLLTRANGARGIRVRRAK